MKTLAQLILVVILTMTTVAHAAIPTGIVHDGTIYDAAADTTTFWYSIWPQQPSASHVVLAVCPENEIVSVSWSPHSYGYDPTTEFTGLKLDNLPDLQAPLAVSIVMVGQRTAQPIPVRIKAGQQIQPGATVGPACGPNAVALAQLSAQPASRLKHWLNWLIGRLSVS